MFSIAHRICVFTLAAAGLYAQTTTTPPPADLVTHTTGLVGIAEGQTAQFNALNPGDGGATCTGVLNFIAADGTVFKPTTVTVGPGTGQHIDLDSVADLALAVGARKSIRATITIPAAPPPSTSTSTSASTTTTPPVRAACRLIGTLEIYTTSTGHTLVTLGADHKVVNVVATPAS
jgi:hypothetical protein